MDKPTPSTSVRHNDALSNALIESYKRWMDGDTFQGSSIEEEGIPSLEKKEDLDDGTKKDPKANAGRPDPVGGVKQSHGAEIRDTTKLVAREEAENVEEAKKGLYANIHAKRKRGEAPAKPGSEDYPAKDAFKKAARTAKEEVSFELDGVTYVFEREVIEEGMKQARKNVGASTCWKGYKAKGTKTKDGKEVPNCVKEEKNKCSNCGGSGIKEGKECGHCGGTGYHTVKEYFEKDPKTGKMVKKHDCAKKVKKEGLEYTVIPGEHTMLEDGTVTHYDIVREGSLLRNVPVEELEIVLSETHEHFDNHAKNAEVLGEKKLDPVNHKALKGDHADRKDKDIDNDGDVDKSDKYLHNRRKTVSKIIAAKNKSAKK